LGARLREHDIAGLEVAMNETLAMRLVERVGDFGRDAQRLGNRQRATLETLRKRLALDVLHHQEVHSVLVADVEERADVGVVQARDGARLAVEARPQIGGHPRVPEVTSGRHAATTAFSGALGVMAAIGLVALLSGCATARPLMEGPRHEVGIASYYSRDHDGRRTASGECFDMDDMTAAHRTLPFGTRVRVTNLRNG